MDGSLLRQRVRECFCGKERRSCDPGTGELAGCTLMTVREENREGRCACLKAGDMSSIGLVLHIRFVESTVKQSLEMYADAFY